MRKVRRIISKLILWATGAVAMIILWRLWMMTAYQKFTFTAEDVPPQKVAIVFGARVMENGYLSSMLYDRVETAVQLYQAGKVQKLLMSGDNPTVYYDEPTAMMNYAIARGVSAEDIQPDFAGRRTYDTCYRAKAIFQLDEVILVTQNFHLSRALFTCRALGIDAVGVPADLQPYGIRSLAWSQAREILASARAFPDVILRHPSPVLGDPIPIN